MKKLLLFISIGLFNQLNAQTYTITEANHMIAQGDTSRFYVCDTGAVSLTSILNTAGSNVTWNFTGVGVTSTVVTTSYASTLSVPASSNYPGCNLVQGTSNFYKNSSSPGQVELLGAAVPGAGASLNFTNSVVVAKFPFALTNTNTDNFGGTVTFTSNGTFSGSVNINADGNGTLVLPTGQVLTNVTRIKTRQTTNINGLIPLFPIVLRITNYDYYHVSDKFPVFTVSYNSLLLGIGTPTITGTVRSNKAVTVVGLDEKTLNASHFRVYPNPASSSLTIESLENGIEPAGIKIYSITGQIVLKQPFDSSINVSNLKAGMYYLEISTSKGGVYKQKLVVN